MAIGPSRSRPASTSSIRGLHGVATRSEAGRRPSSATSRHNTAGASWRSRRLACPIHALPGRDDFLRLAPHSRRRSGMANAVESSVLLRCETCSPASCGYRKRNFRRQRLHPPLDTELRSSICGAEHLTGDAGRRGDGDQPAGFCCPPHGQDWRVTFTKAVGDLSLRAKLSAAETRRRSRRTQFLRVTRRRFDRTRSTAAEYAVGGFRPSDVRAFDCLQVVRIPRGRPPLKIAAQLRDGYDAANSRAALRCRGPSLYQDE